jgi:hypothetical protein
MPRSYLFGEQLRYSEGAHAGASCEDILLREIPGAMRVARAGTANDRTGTDYWVEVYGRHLSVDVKVRRDDWAAHHRDEDDLALETWSVCETKVGWTRDPAKRCDYVLWLWVETGRFCLVPFPLLCRVFALHWQQWKPHYKCRRQSTPSGDGGYQSECVFVPRRVVWRAIYERFGGMAA